MSVHQIEEYYIHIEIPLDKVHEVITLVDYDEMDHELDNRYLTIDGFTSESDAIEYESKIKDLL